MAKKKCVQSFVNKCKQMIEHTFFCQFLLQRQMKNTLRAYCHNIYTVPIRWGVTRRSVGPCSWVIPSYLGFISVIPVKLELILVVFIYIFSIISIVMYCLIITFLTFSACFSIPIIFSNMNSNCSNLYAMRNLQEQVKKHSVTKNCSDLSLFE